MISQLCFCVVFDVVIADTVFVSILDSFRRSREARTMATSIGVAEFWDSLDDSQRNEALLVHKVSKMLGRVDRCCRCFVFEC